MTAHGFCKLRMLRSVRKQKRCEVAQLGLKSSYGVNWSEYYGFSSNIVPMKESIFLLPGMKLSDEVDKQYRFAIHKG